MWRVFSAVLTNCVTLDESFNLDVPQLLCLEMVMLVVSLLPL